MVTGISYWLLNEASDDREDSYGTNDLYIANEAGNRPGVVTNALNCVRTVTGTRCEIENSDQTGLDPLNTDFSCFGFVLTDEVAIAGEKRTVFCKKTLIDTTWALLLDGTYGWVFETSKNGATEDRLINVASISNDLVYFVGVSYNASAGRRRIVVNGNIVAEDIITNGDTLYSSNIGFSIGSLADGGWAWDGWIQNVGYVADELTSTQWSEVYNSGVPFTSTEFRDWIEGTEFVASGQEVQVKQGAIRNKVPEGFPSWWINEGMR